MKKILRLTIVVLCAAWAPQSLQAQYQYPSQERMQELLDQLEYCKQELKATQLEIKNMEENASEYTLAEYQESKMLVDRIKTCIAASRAELDNIRKEYPGWFNAKNAVLPYDRHQEMTPISLEERLGELDKKIEEILNRFNDLDKPTN